MNDTALETILLAGAALVLLAGKAESHKMALLRASLTVVLATGAVVVWALARYWS